MPANYQGRPNKARARRSLLGGIERRSCVVTLPGVTAECVKLLIRNGSIDTKTKQVWFERDRNREAALLRCRDDLGLNATVRIEEVTNEPLPQGIDLLNLDLEEGFSVGLGLWLERNSHRFAVGASFIVWMTNHSRNTRVAAFNEWLGRQVETDRTLQAVRFHCQELLREEHGVTASPAQINALVAIRCALKDRKIDIRGFEQYADSRWDMFAIRFEIGAVEALDTIKPFSSLADTFDVGYQKGERKNDRTSAPEPSRNLKSRKVTVSFRERFLIGQTETGWIMMNANDRKIVAHGDRQAILNAFLSDEDNQMYEKEQKTANMRSAGHKAHATRNTKLLAAVEQEMQSARGAAKTELKKQADLLRSKIATHLEAARRAEYQRRGYLAASTRAA